MKKLLCLILIIVLSPIFYIGCSKDIDRVFAVWWWNDELDFSYIDFAKENNINEIYLCSSKFNQETNSFIQYAQKKDISVYYLAGDSKYLDDRTNLDKKIQDYINYQTNFSNKFCGIHLDIEPQQHSNFKTNRVELITNLIELVYENSINYPDIEFNYDISFWLDDEITFNDSTKPAYQHIIDYSDRITIMSYRDNFEDILKVAQEEIAYAKQLKKQINLGVETNSSEGDKVSFLEEGKTYMNNQLSLLRQNTSKDIGVCIHHIKTWFDLPN